MNSQMAFTSTCQCVIYLELAEFKPDSIGNLTIVNRTTILTEFLVSSITFYIAKVSNSVAEQAKVITTKSVIETVHHVSSSN